MDTFDFLLNPLFFWYREKNQKPDWLNFTHFSEYKYKIKLVSRLRKREDLALISISTILKFQALEIKKKRGFSINPDIHYSKVPSSGYFSQTLLNSTVFLNLLQNIIENFRIYIWKAWNYKYGWTIYFILKSFWVEKLCSIQVNQVKMKW